MRLASSSTGIAAALTVFSACAPNVDVGAEAEIRCAANDECPEDFECNAIGRCQRRGSNAPPSLTLAVSQAANRYVDAVVLLATVADTNSDVVDIEVEFSTDGQNWCPASVELEDTSAFALGDGVDASPDGEPYFIEWAALEDAGRCGLSSADFEVLTGFDADDTPLTESRDLLQLVEVELRATPTDQGNPRRAGAPALVEPFAIGESLPLIEPLSIDCGGECFDDIPLEFFLFDESFDAVDIELQFRVPGEAWREAELIGPVADLGTVPESDREFVTPYLVVWRSDAPPPAADESGGVGLVIADGVELRIRAETFLDDALVFGPWVSFPALRVVNQTAPRIDNLRVLNLGTEHHSGVLHLGYALDDLECDRADVAFEFSVDGVSWQPCTEFPSLVSSGRYDLPSRPEVVFSRPDSEPSCAREHVFAWAVGEDVSTPVDGVEIRAFAADTIIGLPTVLTVAQPVGPIALGQSIDDFDCDVVLNTADRAVQVAAPDLNGDGRLELIGLGGSDPYRIWTWDDAQPVVNPYPSFDALARPSSTSSAFALVDLLGSPEPDLAVLGALGSFRVYENDGTGALSVKAPDLSLSGGVIGEMPAGDFDGDGDTDLLSGAGTTLQVVLNPGDDSSAFSAVSIALDDPVIAVNAADLDGDGVHDAVVTLETDRISVDSANELVFARLVVLPGLGDSTLFGAPVALADESNLYFNGDAQPGEQYRGSVVRFADLDRDERLDFVVADSFELDTSRVRVFRQREDGSFEENQLSETAPGRAAQMRLEDFNGDGRVDIALLGRDGTAGGWLTVFASVAPRSVAFGRFASLATPATGFRLDFVLGDFDGLGDIDVAFAVSGVSAGSQNLHLCRRNPSSRGISIASFESREVSRGLDADALAALDLNQDGTLDLVGTRSEPADVLAYETPRDSFVGGFGELAPRATSVTLNPAEALNLRPLTALGDLDGDGALDAASASFARATAVTVNRGQRGDDRILRFLRATRDTSFGSGYEALVAGDFDDDGREDVVLSAGPASASASFKIAEPVGTRPDGSIEMAESSFLSLSGFEYSTVSTYYGDVGTGDFNQDGITDLVLGGRNTATGGHQLVILFAKPATGECTVDAPGTPFCAPCFVPPASPVARPFGGLAVGDFTADGALDVAYLADGDVVVLERSASSACGRAALQRASGVAPGSLGLTAAELTGDGLVDLLTRGGGSVQAIAAADPFAEGWEPGRFLPAVTLDIPAPPAALGESRAMPVVADLDADGLVDILSPVGSTLHVGFGRRARSSRSWVQRLVFGLGGTIDPDAPTRFGSALPGAEFRIEALGVRPHAGPLPSWQRADERIGGFELALARSGLVAPAERSRLVALSPVINVTGGQRAWSAEEEPFSGPQRHAVIESFGQLALNTDPNRSVELSLPIYPHRLSELDDLQNVRVFLLVRDWLRADALAVDRIREAPGAARYLAKRDGEPSLVYERLGSWIEIPAIDLDGGVDGFYDSGTGTLQVPLAHFGYLRAYVVLP